ncbi:MAG TPA: sigma-70 family RNA polymerase sigma factor [Rhodocyclaceae bacterium]|nr:sigma-70 family RNA polymerase sigma factor [Rhodocyclaceae bacterium]
MKDLIQQIEPLIPAFRRYARALLRNAELADDLVQDCLERIVSRWPQRRDADDTRQWAFAILHNLAIDVMRRRTRRGIHLALDELEEHEMAVPAQQEDRLRHADLMRALDALPQDQRAVVLLISIEDMSYADVARTLDIPIGTVMSRLSRGRERLQRVLDDGSIARVSTVQATPLRRMK